MEYDKLENDKEGIRSIRKWEIFIKNSEDAGEFICIKN